MPEYFQSSLMNENGVQNEVFSNGKVARVDVNKKWKCQPMLEASSYKTDISQRLDCIFCSHLP